MTAAIAAPARDTALKVLRVGDGVVRRTPAGHWISPTYYQVDQILGGFDQAGVDAQLTAFSRIICREFAGYRLPQDRFAIRGVTVASKGIRSLSIRLRETRRRLLQAINEADVVWAMLPSMLGLLAVELSASRKPCAVQLVGDPAVSLRSCRSGPAGKALALVGSWLVRRAIGKAQGAIFVSPALARRYGSHAAHSIVANESRLAAAQLRAASRVRAGAGAGNRLLFVGRISPEKGLPLLLDAIGSLPSAHLTIVGEGPQKHPLQQRCTAPDLAGRVVFLGELAWGEPVLEVMRRHDILVLPSLTEGMPLVLLEAMSQGLPVVATRVGGVPDLVCHGENGLLVDSQNPLSLAQGIGRLIADADLRMRLALAGLETARDNTAEAQYGRAAAYIARVTQEAIV